MDHDKGVMILSPGDYYFCKELNKECHWEVRRILYRTGHTSYFTMNRAPEFVGRIPERKDEPC